MESKTILITGSTRGIGFCLAKEFLTKKHQVIINGTTQQHVDKALAELSRISSEVIGVTGKVEDSDTFENLIKEGLKTFGKIDIWINNAGVPQPHKYFWELENKEIKSLININIFGLMSGTKSAINFFNKQGYGKVFNMEGLGSKGRMVEKIALYGSSKRTVNYFTKAISKEIKNPKIHIGILSPGMVRTDFINMSSNHSTEKEKKQFEKVYKILAEDPEPVTHFLSEKILKSNKNYDRIEYLTFVRMLPKIIRMMFT